ncbi:PQQ-binding-like beta-propeller repeat protein [Kitasatospora purpeofusca]|uniref:PQQ-binding-like beta-propeller repeat protein n=1 Tax=Kitasatospora purpeofusca TaxID=67352 RepID=UPI000691D41C|nr:PQQ-binding-like beta-propeller repeat protein [Kitasatospora purpeofusca]
MSKQLRKLLPAAATVAALLSPLAVTAGTADAAPQPDRSCGTVTDADSAAAASLNTVLTGKLAHAMTAYRFSCARAIVAATRAHDLSDQAAVIAVTTAIVESELRNNPNVLDASSVGLFQQQTWWGSTEERLNPAYSTNAFLDGMLKAYPNGAWKTQPVGVVCQKVQVSAFPGAYQPQAADAQRIVAAMASAPPAPAPAPASKARVSTVGSDGALYATDGDYAGTGWSGAWATQGGTGLKALASTVTGNTVHVYALGSTGHVYTKDADYTTGQWTTTWLEVPGGAEGATAVSATTIGNRVHLNIVGSDGALHTTDADYAGTGWSGTWVAMGGTGLKALASTVTGNTMHIFALSSTGHVYTMDADYGTGQWSSAWQEVPGGAEGAEAITAAATGNRVHLNIVGSDGALHTTDGDYAGTGWSGTWTSQGGTGLRKAVASAVTGNTVHVYTLGATGRVYTKDANYDTGQWTATWQEVPGGADDASTITATTTH